MNTRTGFVWHETFMWHSQGKFSGLFPAIYPVQPGQHYETPESKRRIKNLMDACGLTRQLVPVDPRPASDAELERVHTPAYLAQLARDNALPEASAGFDAPFTRGSFDLARLAAGGAIEAVSRIISGEIDNAYMLARPVGHHAESGIGKGFCLVNNCAIAAAHALASGLERVAMVDVDVHHGNGAEEIFWRDPRVLTISVHQDRWFPPDTGDVSAVGEGPGHGTNLNIPLPAGSGWGAYRAALDEVIIPALDAFKPQMIFVPFGLDAGAQDPLGRMILGSNHFRQIADALKGAARRHAGGRIMVTHEGGYNEATTPFMALAVVEAISGIASGVTDPYGAIMDGMPGHDILAHQRGAVDAAKANLDLLRYVAA
jgi:acetoin utilization deacetylase AcuC-like enzyme